MASIRSGWVEGLSRLGSFSQLSRAGGLVEGKDAAFEWLEFEFASEGIDLASFVQIAFKDLRGVGFDADAACGGLRAGALLCVFRAGLDLRLSCHGDSLSFVV